MRRVWGRSIPTAAIVLFPALTGFAEPQSTTRPADATHAFHFDGDKPGQLPAGWRIDATSPTADLATWQVVADKGAPSPPHVLALTRSKNYDGTYNLAVAPGVSLADVDLSVRVKAISGSEDQGGGPVWRFQDAKNYYISRFNPLESNFRVYVVADGKRRQLATYKVELSAGRWYTIRIRMQGRKIECYLDGDRLLEAEDGTIGKPGTIGLWTKADAVTSFDDLVVRKP